MEAFRELRGRLEPGGVLALNFLALAEPGRAPAWLALYRTMCEAFPNLRAFRVQGPASELANILFFASEALAAAPVLTNDDSPLEALHARAAVLWRRGVLETTRGLLIR